MGKKKKIHRLVDAVQHLFSSPLDRKVLRKAAAFESFLNELRARRDDLAADRDEASNALRRQALTDDLELVDAQIEKAERLLARLQEG